MANTEKRLQLQIRVSAAEKKAIHRAAEIAGVGMSEYVLSRLLPQQKTEFQECLKKLKNSKEVSYVLAEIHDLFHKTTASEFEEWVEEVSLASLSPYLQNYLAAMIEQAAVQKQAKIPSWMNDIAPLETPVFGSDLESLKLYLLTESPIPFRRRNIFIDATLGDRV